MRWIQSSLIFPVAERTLNPWVHQNAPNSRVASVRRLQGIFIFWPQVQGGKSIIKQGIAR